MCGILGVVNGTKSNIRELTEYMRNGCVTGTLRGDDSTGVFQFNKGEYNIFKLPVSGEIFNKSKTGHEAFFRADEPGFTILHHRAATRGSVTYENCHPFEHNYDEEGKFVVGVHNGTLSQAWSKHEDMKFDVDSDYLYYRIYREGAPKALGDIKGSYALVWMEEDGNLRIAANGERSIYFAFVKNKNVMLIASEAGMLWWLATRNGIEIEQIVAPVKDQVHTFELSDLRKYTTTAIEKKVEVFTTARQSSDWTGQRQHSTTGTGSHMGTMVERLAKYGLTIGQVVKFYTDGNGAVPYNKVTGYVDVGDGADLVKACIYAPRPEAVDAINEAVEGCIEVPIRAISSVTVRNPAGLVEDSEDCIVCGDPLLVVSSSDLPDVGTIQGPNSRLLTKAEYTKRTKDGCMQCGGVITVANAPKLIWVNNDSSAICPECATEWKEHIA